MTHVRYAANPYWFVALACAAIAFFIIIQYLIRFISETYKLHSGGGKRAIERMRNLKRVEPPEPEPVSPDLPLQVSAEVQPILEHAEPPKPEPAVSLDVPLQVSAEVQPILEQPPEPEPAVNPDLPLQVSAEVQPILEQPPEPEPAVSPDVPLQVSAEVQPILEHAESPEPKPAVNLDVSLQVSAEVQPILEQTPEPEPAVNPDVPLQVSAEAQPILEHAEPPEPEPAVNLDVSLQVSAEVQPILEHAEPPEPEPAVSPDLPLQVSAEAQPILEHAESPEPELAVNLDVSLQVSAEVQPILEHAEPPEPEPAVSPDLPLQVSAEVQPILEHAEPPEPEPAVSLDVPLQVSAEAQPILEHAEPPEPERAVSGNVYTAQKDYDRAIANYDEAIKFDPKFAVAYEEISPEDKSAVKEARPFKGSIGVTIRRVTDGAAHALNVTPARGALVVAIDENGPAEAAGIEPADVIVKVDGKDVKECRDLPRIVADTTAGKDVALTIIRKGKELTKTVKVGRLEDGSAPQEEPVAVDPKSEAAAKHPAPGMAIFEIQQQPVSSDPLLLVLPVPPRFGRRRFDHVSKVSH